MHECHAENDDADERDDRMTVLELGDEALEEGDVLGRASLGRYLSRIVCGFHVTSDERMSA